MTTQPERQDGDGRAFVAAMQRYPVGDPANANADELSRNRQHFIEGYKAALRADTSSSNGAEGVGDEDVVKCCQCGDPMVCDEPDGWQACPRCMQWTDSPQPAPDAVRILERIRDFPHDGSASAQGMAQLATDAIKALFAPVPSPDGAGDVRFALEIARQEIVLAIAFLGRDAGTDRLPGTISDLIERLSKADAAIRSAISPATGAAGQRWYVGAQNDGLFIINAPPRPSNDHPWHDNPNGPTIALNVTELPLAKAQKIVDVMNGLAAPLVRGDRDSPVKIIQRELEIPVADSRALYTPKPLAERIADAILSLPVQPGAGEGERSR